MNQLQETAKTLATTGNETPIEAKSNKKPRELINQEFLPLKKENLKTNFSQISEDMSEKNEDYDDDSISYSEYKETTKKLTLPQQHGLMIVYSFFRPLPAQTDDIKIKKTKNSDNFKEFKEVFNSILKSEKLPPKNN